MASDILRKCPVCDCDEPHPWLRKGSLQLVRCHRCSMIYTNPVPREFASGDYYDGAASEYYLSPNKLESDYSDVRFERELRLFRKHCLGGSVLDVGCSSGGFLFQLNKSFPGAYQVLGTDVNGPPLDYAESRSIPVIRGNFLEQDFGAKKFDAVTLWAVLEHLSAPKAFLDKAWSLLKPDGCCFVLVPNMESLAARLIGARYRYIYPQHLNYFTRETIGKLLHPKWALVEHRSTHFNPIVIWQDWRRGGEEISNRERGELLKRTTKYKESPWLKPVKAFYKLTEIGLSSFNLADNLAFVLSRK